MSGRPESDWVFLLPKQVYYRYTTPRFSCPYPFFPHRAESGGNLRKQLHISLSHPSVVESQLPAGNPRYRTVYPVYPYDGNQELLDLLSHICSTLFLACNRTAICSGGQLNLVLSPGNNPGTFDADTPLTSSSEQHQNSPPDRTPRSICRVSLFPFSKSYHIWEVNIHPKSIEFVMSEKSDCPL